MARKLDDYQLKSKLRAAFVKNGFDTALLKFGVHRGFISVSGNLKDSTVTSNKKDVWYYDDDGSDGGQTEQRSNMTKKLFMLEQELRGIPGVRGVSFDFDNV